MADACRNRRNWCDTNRQHVRLQNVIQQRRLTGTNSAKNSDLKRGRFHSVEQHAQHAPKLDQTMCGNDPFNLAEQPNLVTRLAQLLEPTMRRDS